MKHSDESYKTVSKTPLFRLNKNIFLKCEFLHPGRSHKARVAKAMMDSAENNGDIVPGVHTILERTGGNLGIALAIEATARGYKLELVTDPSYSKIKRNLAGKLGAKVINRGESYPYAKDNGEVVKELLSYPNGKKYHYLHQFANPVNPLIHETTTGQEIVQQLIDYGVSTDQPIILVKGLGTGASIKGISNALYKYFDSVKVFGVEPVECDIKNNLYVDHDIQGIAVGEPPPFFNIDKLDSIIKVSYENTLSAQNALLRETRFYVGLSSAANYHALNKAIAENSIKDRKAIYVSVLYDRGEDYEE